MSSQLDLEAEEFLESIINAHPIELELDAAVLEFDQELSSAMDELFGDQLANLQVRIVEPDEITTESSKATHEDPEELEVSIPNSRLSDRLTASSSDPVSSYAGPANVIVRSTSLAAPVVSKVGEVSGSSKTPPVKEQTTITRSTNTAAAPFAEQSPSKTLAEPAAASASVCEDMSFDDSPRFAYRATSGRSISPPLQSQSSATPCDAPPPVTHESGSAAFGHYPTVPQFAASSIHRDCLMVPSPSWQNAGLVNEDIEMTSSDMFAPSPFTPPTNAWIGVPSGPSASFLAPPPRQWPNLEASFPSMGQSSDTIFSSTPPTFAVPQPQRMHSAPFAALEPTHFSIFELIESEPKFPPHHFNSYTIPPAIVPQQLWQEMNRERPSHPGPRPPKRSRLSPPYFVQTPLIAPKKARRSKKTTTAMSPSQRVLDAVLSNDDSSPPRTLPRAPSPAFSCSSDLSFTSSGSFASISTTSSYSRKLSSPPPLRQRIERVTSRRHQHSSVLKSISWLWSGRSAKAG